MQCRDLREIADSYLSDELMIETNHDILKHLETCADCRREMAARRDVRAKLRAAFAEAPDLQMSDEYAARLRTQLRAAMREETRSAKHRTWFAIAACLMLAAVAGFIVIRQRERARQELFSQSTRTKQSSVDESKTNKTPNGSSPNDASTAVSLAMTEMTEGAVGDHRNCAVKFRLPKPPIPLEEAGREYDRVYFNLAKAVLDGREDFPGNVEFVKAHSCVFNGQRFGHVILKYHGRLVSVIVTDLTHAANATASAAQTPSGANQLIVTACPQVQGYRVSCFETVRHAVFVVSDLTETENTTLARALAPSVYQHVMRAETIV
jgi:hypothetical protein